MWLRKQCRIAEVYTFRGVNRVGPKTKAPVVAKQPGLLWAKLRPSTHESKMRRQTKNKLMVNRFGADGAAACQIIFNINVGQFVFGKA